MVDLRYRVLVYLDYCLTTSYGHAETLYYILRTLALAPFIILVSSTLFPHPMNPLIYFA